MSTTNGTAPPAELADWHRRAREKLAPEHYDYFAGGVAEETALAENEQAFRRRALLPRILRGNAERDLSVALPGGRASMPVLVSPTAFHQLAHPDGERATARAVAAAGTVLISSMAATVAIGEVTEAARTVDHDATVWFQLYLQTEWQVTTEVVRAAERAGCAALVVTVDSPVFGRHVRDRRNGFRELPDGLSMQNMPELPGMPRKVGMSAALSWEHVQRLRELTALPVWLKGVLHPADALLAAEHGVDGIIVSNHGGRQLDATPAPVDALPAIRDAVGDRLPLLIDGGVRRGSDVAVAVALGARAVGVGRPVVWGLAADGEAGVRGVLELLREEFDDVLTLCGGRTPAELTPDQVTVRGSWQAGR